MCSKLLLSEPRSAGAGEELVQGKRSDPDGEAVVGIGSERSDQGL